jgi:hypothetical protein
MIESKGACTAANRAFKFDSNGASLDPFCSRALRNIKKTKKKTNKQTKQTNKPAPRAMKRHQGHPVGQ